MKISNEQKAVLKSFKCERLSESEDVKQCALQIVSDKGSQLVEYLLTKGEEEDSSGLVAYYVIRNKDNLPLAFFSLKCGLLFAPSLIKKAEEVAIQKGFFINTLERGKDETDPNSVAVFSDAENLAAKYNCSVEEMIPILKDKKSTAVDYKIYYHQDEIIDRDNPIYRVHSTYPGIEIVHFCTNDNAKQYWSELNMNNHSMGEVLFWFFIFPKIKNVQKIAGCQYAYLFAADLSEEKTLVKYYNNSLGFIKPKGIGTSKPYYDYCCEFLVQKISKLNSFRDEYFKNFNLVEDTEIS